MSGALLLTGDPGCGKTTLIRRVVARVAGPTGGFYTEEIRASGVRQGFAMVTFEGARGILAHRSIPGPPRVGAYGVDRAALDAIGTASIRRALDGVSLIVIDEIGPMEMTSPAFCQAVLDALDGGVPILGTIVRRSKPFSDRIKARPDVEVITVTRANRDLLLAPILDRLRAAGLTLTE